MGRIPVTWPGIAPIRAGQGLAAGAMTDRPGPGPTARRNFGAKMNSPLEPGRPAAQVLKREKA